MPGEIASLPIGLLAKTPHEIAMATIGLLAKAGRGKAAWGLYDMIGRKLVQNTEEC